VGASSRRSTTRGSRRTLKILTFTSVAYFTTSFELTEDSNRAQITRPCNQMDRADLYSLFVAHCLIIIIIMNAIVLCSVFVDEDRQCCDSRYGSIALRIALNKLKKATCRCCRNVNNLANKLGCNLIKTI